MHAGLQPPDVGDKGVDVFKAVDAGVDEVLHDEFIERAAACDARDRRRRRAGR